MPVGMSVLIVTSGAKFLPLYQWHCCWLLWKSLSELSKPMDTSACSVLIWINPCSALEDFESPFLKSSTRSRCYPCRGAFVWITDWSWPAKYLGLHLPDLFSPSNLSELTSRNDWKTCEIVPQYRTDLGRKLSLHIPKKPSREKED